MIDWVRDTGRVADLAAALIMWAMLALAGAAVWGVWALLAAMGRR